MTLIDVMKVYDGSDGEATKRLYVRLSQLGASGELALNLFRAQKASARAKVYRGGVPGQGSYRSMAYQKKNWSMANLTNVLLIHSTPLGIRWGWKEDPKAEFHRWVLYVDLPTGQVSFHADGRGGGPDYSGEWDGQPGMSVQRIIRYVAELVALAPTQAVV